MESRFIVKGYALLLVSLLSLASLPLGLWVEGSSLVEVLVGFRPEVDMAVGVGGP